MHVHFVLYRTLPKRAVICYTARRAEQLVIQKPNKWLDIIQITDQEKQVSLGRGCFCTYNMGRGNSLQKLASLIPIILPKHRRFHRYK